MENQQDLCHSDANLKKRNYFVLMETYIRDEDGCLLCSLVDTDWRFRGTYCLNHRGDSDD
jgi:hypothetical protein